MDDWIPRGWDLFFWRDRSREIDFLRHRGRRFDLADAKLTRTPSQRDLAALRRVASELPDGSVESLSVSPSLRDLREGVGGGGARDRAPDAHPLADDGWARPADAPWPR